MASDPSALPYRHGVGLCLFNRRGLVLMAERRDRQGSWQMPQGGVQKHEEIHVAALRELKEEIGTDNAEILALFPEKQRYEFPDWHAHKNGLFRGKYRGQEQDWFALRFLGEDADINLEGEHDPENPEFSAWRWMPLAETPPLLVSFKRPIYEKIAAAFAPLAEALARGEALPIWKP